MGIAPRAPADAEEPRWQCVRRCSLGLPLRATPSPRLPSRATANRAWELSRAEASGQAFSSGEDFWGPFWLWGSGIGDIVTQQLRMSQELCVSQLTAQKRQEAVTADGGSTRAHVWVWTEPHRWEPPGIFGEVAKSRGDLEGPYGGPARSRSVAEPGVPFVHSFVLSPLRSFIWRRPGSAGLWLVPGPGVAGQALSSGTHRELRDINREEKRRDKETAGSGKPARAGEAVRPIFQARTQRPPPGMPDLPGALGCLQGSLTHAM
nr:uncharacterized protein LOC131750464 [Kogia breviceps]